MSELADRLALARPTVHGLLQTLQVHGFVEQDPVSDKYQLGAGLLQLGYSYLDLNELRARSVSHADRLAARTGEAVRVGVEHGPSVVVIHHAFRPDATMQIPEVGQQLPLHATALGKAMLAFRSNRTLDDLTSEPLPKLTKHSAGAIAGAIAIAGDTKRIMRRGPSKGISAAVIEAARGISRELGAPRWPHVA